MSEELAQRIANLRAALDAGALDEATFEAAVVALQAGYAGSAGGGSAVAQGPGSMAAGGGSLINTGIIEGNVYMGEPTDDPVEALRIYREVMVTSSERLPLRTIDVRASDPRAAGRLQRANEAQADQLACAVVDHGNRGPHAGHGVVVAETDGVVGRVARGNGVFVDG